MAGTAVGAVVDNIKTGMAFGITVGVALSTLTILFRTCRQKKK